MQCIRLNQRCDQREDCANSADEHGCYKRQESALVGKFDMYPPAYVSFSLQYLMSMGHIHQADVQHWGRPCPHTHFLCPGVEYYCLPVMLRCNGVNDCPRQEDEAGCDTYTCPGR